jgi:hypothetical protein
VPPPHAALRVASGHELDDRPRARVDVTVDLEVGTTAVRIDELGGEREHQCTREGMKAVDAV